MCLAVGGGLRQEATISGMLTMFHANWAQVSGDQFIVDRKFLTGMQRMASTINSPITTVHPKAQSMHEVMDAVAIPINTLPYRVMVVATDTRWRPVGEDEARVRALIAASRLVYYEDFDVKHLCRDLRAREVVMLECDLRTQIQLATLSAASLPRKLVRALRCVGNYARTTAALRRAEQVHCNGYPAFEEVGHINAERRLLYLDSRMTREDVIAEDALATRLKKPTTSPLRLLFSGRYESLKGSLDAVKVGVEALERGLNVEMHLYGQGSEREAMQKLASAHAQRIVIHDAVPYPELVKIARGFDVFVCCHVQSDPSCTYLESFGAGLPVVGYDNRMWRGLHAASGAGFPTPMHKPSLVVDAVARYATDSSLLAEHSKLARQFALDHCFEAELAKRTDDLNRLLSLAGKTNLTSRRDPAKG
jgi:colanic acid/amylovoran biosynthesis glycosyltransferase